MHHNWITLVGVNFYSDFFFYILCMPSSGGTRNVWDIKGLDLDKIFLVDTSLWDIEQGGKWPRRGRPPDDNRHSNA